MREKQCRMTKALVIINVVWFFFVYINDGMQDAESMLRFGAMTSEAIERGSYGQLITAMFLHFDLRHATNNMIMLFALGSMLEEHTGKVRFLILYLLAGIGGNVISALWHMGIGKIVLSAGASGAVFGIVGAFLGVVIVNRGRLENMTTKKLLLFAGLSLYQGFASQGIDNAAHVGGFVVGLLAAIISELLLNILNRKDRVISE